MFAKDLGYFHVFHLLSIALASPSDLTWCRHGDLTPHIVGVNACSETRLHIFPPLSKTESLPGIPDVSLLLTLNLVKFTSLNQLL